MVAGQLGPRGPPAHHNTVTKERQQELELAQIHHQPMEETFVQVSQKTFGSVHIRIA